MASATEIKGIAVMASATEIEGIAVTASATEIEGIAVVASIEGIAVMVTEGRMAGLMVGPGPTANGHRCPRRRTTVPLDTEHLRHR